jgi:hypothetical protein
MEVAPTIRGMGSLPNFLDVPIILDEEERTSLLLLAIVQRLELISNNAMISCGIANRL